MIRSSKPIGVPPREISVMAGGLPRQMYGFSAAYTSHTTKSLCLKENTHPDFDMEPGTIAPPISPPLPPSLRLDALRHKAVTPPIPIRNVQLSSSVGDLSSTNHQITPQSSGTVSASNSSNDLCVIAYSPPFPLPCPSPKDLVHERLVSNYPSSKSKQSTIPAVVDGPLREARRQKRMEKTLADHALRKSVSATENLSAALV